MVGIDDIELYLPKCFLPIETLAKHNDLDVLKLQKGLGLYNMSIPDADEDVVTMAAEALINLLKKNPDIEPNEIGRIYVGTESSIDGAKPIASYLTGLLNQYFQSINKPQMKACDSVDLVFACIGAIDAMENCLLWLSQHPTKKAIVVATDNAKYELASTGEYTQGAGAVAMLLAKNPRILEIPLTWGCSTSCAHDFFKPFRFQAKDGQHEKDSSHELAREIDLIHNDCPIFDGPKSNATYQDRMVQAYENFSELSSSDKPISSWDKVVFHQPYAFHGRRIFSPLFLEMLAKENKLDAFAASHGIGTAYQVEDDRAIRKSSAYQDFVTTKIEAGEKASMHVGNMYTGSIFLCLISTLFEAYKHDESLENARIGFIAYGSGAKSKVFEGILRPSWQERIMKLELDDYLLERKELSYEEYKYLHKGMLMNPVSDRQSQVFLNDMGFSDTNYGARNYQMATIQ